MSKQNQAIAITNHVKENCNCTDLAWVSYLLILK
jgi:hypothetical protein